MFSLIISCDWAKTINKTKNDSISFSIIIDWIYENFGEKISRSSISQVKVKLGIESLTSSRIIVNDISSIKTQKELLVIKAFKHFEIIEYHE